MKFLLILVLVINVLPLLTTAIRCYKCDATNECKIMTKEASMKSFEDSSDNVEVVDCEYNCWKSVSLGNEIVFFVFEYSCFLFCFVFEVMSIVVVQKNVVLSHIRSEHFQAVFAVKLIIVIVQLVDLLVKTIVYLLFCQY